MRASMWIAAALAALFLTWDFEFFVEEWRWFPVVARHFLLRFQIFIGYGAIAIGLYLIRKAHADKVGGCERDGTAIGYLVYGLFSVTLGALMVVIPGILSFFVP